jgi:hypothetical protein
MTNCNEVMTNNVMQWSWDRPKPMKTEQARSGVYRPVEYYYYYYYYYYYTMEQLVAIPYFSLRHSSRNKQVEYAPKVLNFNRINSTFLETE